MTCYDNIVFDIEVGGIKLALDAKRESEMFDQAAAYYDQFRPGYPSEIIETIIEQTKLSEDSKVIEIGSGSGKATEYFKDYGFSIRCIDPGEKLVERGNKNYQDYPNIKFERGRFEELEIEEGAYDLIYAAQAFHWVPQPIGYQNCARMLKENGYIAPFWNMYLMKDDNPADQELLKLSNQYGGFADFVNEEQCENRIRSIINGIESSGLFDTPTVYKHLWKQEYTASDYYGFVLTGNRFIQLPEEQKEMARLEIQDYVRKYGGKIIRPYLCVLYLAHKKSR